MSAILSTTNNQQSDPDTRPEMRRIRQAKRAYCLPCKERRVKCDMGWPACTRCLKKTRSCCWDARLLPDGANECSLPVFHSAGSPNEWRVQERSHPASQKSKSQNDIPCCRSVSTLTVREILQQPEEFDLFTPQNATADAYNIDHSTHSSTRSLPATAVSSRPPIPVLARYLHAGIPRRLDTDRETLYTNAFFNGWLKQHVVDPEGWTSAFLQHRSTPLLTSAIHLLGNLQVDPHGSAPRYQRCLSLLQRRLTNLQEDSVKIDACVTISLLAGYELCLGTVEAFGHHLHAISALIRSELRHARLLNISSKLYRLVTYSCLDMEMVYNFLVQGVPKIAWDEWQQILPLEVNSSAEDIEYRRICEAMHMVNSLTSSNTKGDEYAITFATGIEILNHHTSPAVAPWMRDMQRCMSSDALRMLWSRKIPILSPYSHLYFYSSANPQESMFHTTYALCFRTLELHLINGYDSIELSEELEEKCNIIAGMVSTLGAVNQSDWWCLLATWTLVKLYRRLLIPSDSRVLYNHALLVVLLQVTNIEGWKLLESKHFIAR